MNSNPFLNPQPFHHNQISNPFGLFVVTDTRNDEIVSYNCTICSKSYSTDINPIYARRNFVKHAKTDYHQSSLLAISILPDVEASSQSEFNCNNPPYVDDSLQQSPDDIAPNLITGVQTFKDDYFESFSLPDNADNEGFSTTEASSSQSPEPLSHKRNVSLSTIHTLKELFGINTSNYLYYLHECQKEKSGFKALLSKCLLNNSQLYDAVKEYDVSLHYNLLKVLSSLSQKQRLSLAQVFSTIVINHKAAHNKIDDPNLSVHSTSSFLNIDIPISYQDFRRSYTHGPNSLWVHLPHPEVYSFSIGKKYNHCYTRVKDCIAHFLASGGRLLPPESICSEAVLKAQLLELNDHEHPIFIKIWADGFEINNVKQNRGQAAWSCTFTIFGKCPINSKTLDNISTTFTLGICKSSDSKAQDVIINRIIDDINYLYNNSTSFYYLHERTVIQARIIILLTSMDQPERRKRNYLLMGNSKPSNRWGYLIPDIEHINNKLPSCSSCIDSMTSNTWNYANSFCSNCYNWDSTLSSTKRKLTHKYLSESIDEIHIEMTIKDMSLTEVKTMATEKGLNEKAAFLIYDHYDNNMKRRRVESNTAPSTQALSDNILSKRFIGSDFYLWTGSPMWKSLSHDIQDNIDAPMHLLFLGIVKSTMGYINDFFKHTNLNRSFTKVMSHKMRCFDTTYKLNWLKIIRFKNNANILDSTGWVSENFVSFSRLFLWYISPLSSLDKATNSHLIPSKDNIHDWTLFQLKRYARIKGIKLVQALDNPKVTTKLEYRCAIIDYWKYTTTVETNVDDVDVNDPFFCTVEDICLLVKFLHNLIFTLMNKNNQPVSVTRNKIERFARLFIFQLYKVTSYLSITDVHLRLWNVQSLLNLGSTFERFGYFDIFWEGGISGESIIKFFKRERSCTSLHNWSYHMLLRYYRRRALELCSPLTTSSVIHAKKQYHIYHSVNEFTSMINANMPLSTLRDIHQNTSFAIFTDENKQLRKIYFKYDMKLVNAFATWYKLETNISTDSPSMVMLPDDYSPEIFLPSIDLEDNLYSIVSYLWSLDDQ